MGIDVRTESAICLVWLGVLYKCLKLSEMSPGERRKFPTNPLPELFFVCWIMPQSNMIQGLLPAFQCLTLVIDLMHRGIIGVYDVDEMCVIELCVIERKEVFWYTQDIRWMVRRRREGDVIEQSEEAILQNDTL